MIRSLGSALSLAALAVLSACGDAAPLAAQSFPACATPMALTAKNPAYLWTPNAVRLVSQPLAPGVFAVYDSDAPQSGPAGVPLATSGGFVIGQKEVLVVESMINRSLFCQLIGLVQAQTALPIRYVVNTSSHGDHNYGNSYLPAGVRVVQHQNTASYIAAHSAEDVAFMKSNFGTDQGLDDIRPVVADTLVPAGQTWSVDLGGVRVEARDYGFAQTGGDLFVSVPGARVLFTGNPLISERPAVPWLLDGHAEDVRTTLARVEAGLPADAIVVPGHGRPLGGDSFRFSLDYLAAMTGAVDAAVKKGLTLEETVAAVTLESFQGYAIWGWVHKVVNVPKTFQERQR